MPHREIKTILVVKLRTLGDILTTFPLLRALKELYPRADLIMAADEIYRDLFAAHPRVDEFWGHPAGELRRRGSWFALRHQFEFIGKIKRRKVDLYIDLYGSARTAQWGVLAGIPERMGFNLRGRKYFYTSRIIAEHRYVVDLNLQFARGLGWQGKDNSLEFFLASGDLEAARNHLQAQGWRPEQPLIVVSPGGGWPVKCWGADRFGAAAGRLARATGARIVLSGAQAETPLVEACRQAAQVPCLTAVGLPLRQAAATISQSRLYLGNDSGPKYFAEAFRVPTLICYGPTDYINNNPASPRHPVAVREIACRPCHSERCRLERRECLDDLAVETVVRQALRLWEETKNR